MALYQPSNITPSTFAGIGAGVIDAADNISISWQVNGTSAMTGYTITVYENTTASRQVWEYDSTSAFQPFYGTDAQGNPVFFICEPGFTWASQGLANGNSYKLKITQEWKNDPNDESESAKSVVQTSESVFITRAAPSLSVSPGSGTLSSVAQTFTAAYSQAQGDAVSWVRWVLSNAAGDVLDDTGTVYTGVLSYTYDRFFSGETYRLQCTVQTASGAEVTATNNYAVSYEMAEQTGGISLSCNPDDSVTLSWAAGADIPGVPSAQDYGTISGGVLHLAAERSITWNTVNGEDMAFSSPYCFAWRGRIAETTTTTETVNSGTWEIVKTYPASHSREVSHTMDTNSWARNPSASDTASERLTVQVSTTAQETTAEKTVNGSFNNINASLGRVEYNQQVTSVYPIKTITAVYDSDYNIEGYDFEKIDDYTYNVILYNTGSHYNEGCSLRVKLWAEYYTGTQTVSTGRTGVSNLALISSTATSTNIGVVNDSQIKADVLSEKSGTCSVVVSYSYSVSPDNLYKATWDGSQTTGTLKSASIKSTTSAGGANVSISGNNYTVTEYSPNNTTATQTVVTLSYTTNDGIGNDSYRTIVTGTKEGAVSAAVTGSTAAGGATVTMGAEGAYTVTMYNDSSSSCTADIAFSVPTLMDADELAEFTDGTTTFSLEVSNGIVILKINGTEETSISLSSRTWYMVAVIRSNLLTIYNFNADQRLIGGGSVSFSSPLPSPVTEVKVYGEQYCDYVFISQNPSYNFVSADFTPIWDDDTLFYAAFASDLQAGTVTSSNALSVAIYRKRGAVLEPVGVFGSGSKSVRDYGIRSGIPYTYELFYISDGTYSAGAETRTVCRRFRQHTLIEAEEDASSPGVYHPVNVWRFRDNVDAGAYTNQNQPVLLENFTKYPLWQPSSPAAKAGTLTALLGRFEDGTYSGDDAAAMDALFALSGSVNPLFYRDMKGNLYMVRLAGPISQTVDNRTGVLAVSVSVPWVEVGDAGDAKIYTEE